MHIDTSFQSKDKKRASEDWGWFEDMPQHRLVNERRYSDGGIGPRAARPTFDPQPAIHFGI
jgi:hypothetical protein